jgi:hypothetical protein
MVWSNIGRSQSKEVTQCKRIGSSPSCSSFRIQTFKITNQKHPEVNSRSQAGASHFGRIEYGADSLDKSIEIVFYQDRINPLIEGMRWSFGYLSRYDPKCFLTYDFSYSDCHNHHFTGDMHG